MKTLKQIANPIKLNLGCGSSYKKGMINIDNSRKVKADIYCDATKLPFKDGYIDLIEAQHLLEDFLDMDTVIKEWHRVLKKNGKLILVVPYFASHLSYGNPRHKHYFSWITLHALFVDDPNYKLKARFKITKQCFRWQSFNVPLEGRFFGFLASICSKCPQFYERFLKYALTFDEIYCEAVKT